MKLTCAPTGESGWTLVDALVVLAITSVVLALAIPSFRGLLNSVRLSNMTNDLLSGILAARSEALKRRSRVVLCKSADASTCAASGGWEQGWIVFHDADNSGSRQDLEPLLHHAPAQPAGWRIRGNLPVAKYVSYDGSGATRTTSGAFQAGTLTVCHESAQRVEARQIIINANGRARIHKTELPECN
jgi:type IV fimbrial biogenesis protein FimT